MSYKYTISNFRTDFPDDNACLDKVFSLRYGSQTHCSKCDNVFSYTRVKGRQCYQCDKCYHQIYPCAGTVFENSKTPLLFTASKNGVSAKEIERQLGVTYKCAWRMLKHIRILMGSHKTAMFGGSMELDETFVGGKNINRHKDKKVEKSQGRSFKDKTPVFGMFERETGQVKAFVVPDTKGKTLKPIIYSQIETGANVYTDEWIAYRGIDKYYNHQFVDHSKGQYADGDNSTNRIENVWSCFKRTIKGSYIKVSRKYLQLYVDESVFRFNNLFFTNS
jgi:transposase-like protein